MAKPTVALLYDFDKTLCDRDMQEYSFIPDMGLTPAEFWGKTEELSLDESMERILSYMYMMTKEAKEKGILLTKEYLNSCGKNFKLFKGVETWFDRINEYGKLNGVNVEHYVISSGVKEIIEGCSIADKFTKIYGCEFHYDDLGIADFPKNVVNYTTKTQYIYRIRKGTFEIYDDEGLNKKIDPKDRHVELSNMIYFGDGLTDVPCMITVKDGGGKSIAVYQPGKISKVKRLILDERCDFIAETNYSENSELDRIVKMVISRIALENSLQQKYLAQVQKAENAADN